MTSPDEVSLVLGGSIDHVLPLRLDQYAAHYRHVRDAFVRFHGDFDPAVMPPPPQPGASAGRWSELAAEVLERRDDLSRVARLTRRQTARLQAAGINNASRLGLLSSTREPTVGAGKIALPVAGSRPGSALTVSLAGAGARALPVVPGVPAAALWRLSRQAALQAEPRTGTGAQEGTVPPFELLPDACWRGFSRLPPPDAADLYFDLEGFPFAASNASDSMAGGGETHGLEYLWGVSSRDVDAEVDGDGGDGGGGRGGGILAPPTAAADALFGPATEYRSWWAHEPAGEKAALEAFVDWASERRARAPGMHIYHYGAYEVSALRRLAGRYGTREDAVDDLLRANVLVDLYEVVRHSMLVGTPSYSIKYVERLYRGERAVGGGAVARGDQSVVAYDAWVQRPDGMDEGSSATLHALREYNRDDCISTCELAQWLHARRCEVCGPPPAAAEPPRVAEGEASGGGGRGGGGGGGGGSGEASPPVDYDTLKVAELKAECRRLGLAVGGLKKVVDFIRTLTPTPSPPNPPNPTPTPTPTPTLALSLALTLAPTLTQKGARRAP